MGTTKTRETKIAWLKSVIEAYFKTHKTPMSKDKLLAEFTLTQNSSVRVGSELLDVLDLSGFIKVKGDEITK